MRIFSGCDLHSMYLYSTSNVDVGILELADAMIAVGDEKASSWTKRGNLDVELLRSRIFVEVSAI